MIFDTILAPDVELTMEIEDQPNSESENGAATPENAPLPPPAAEPADLGDSFGNSLPNDPPPLAYVTESMSETTRKSGLAWSAGIVFFGSVAFTLVLGWFADLLFGSSPWGIVGGIVLGSIIGFIQFFRITSRIFGANTEQQTPPRTLIANDREDQ